jgi:hypothetical protein
MVNIKKSCEDFWGEVNKRTSNPANLAPAALGFWFWSGILAYFFGTYYGTNPDAIPTN